MAAEQIFISYAREDKEWKDKLVKELNTDLDQKDYIVWNDEKLRAGEWEDDIRREISHSTVFILLISSHFVNSSFIGKELTWILKSQGRCRKIIPIILDNYKKEEVSQLLPAISKFQYFPKAIENIKGSPNPEVTWANAVADISLSISRKPRCRRPVWAYALGFIILIGAGMGFFRWYSSSGSGAGGQGGLRSKPAEIILPEYETDCSALLLPFGLVGYGESEKATVLNAVERWIQNQYEAIELGRIKNIEFKDYNEEEAKHLMDRCQANIVFYGTGERVADGHRLRIRTQGGAELTEILNSANEEIKVESILDIEESSIVSGAVDEIVSVFIEASCNSIIRNIRRLTTDRAKVLAQIFNTNFYLQNNDLNRALRSVNTALEVNPNSLIALENKGEILDKQGKKEESIQTYNKYLQLKEVPAVRRKIQVLETNRSLHNLERIDAN